MDRLLRKMPNSEAKSPRRFTLSTSEPAPIEDEPDVNLNKEEVESKLCQMAEIMGEQLKALRELHNRPPTPEPTPVEPEKPAAEQGPQFTVLSFDEDPLFKMSATTTSASVSIVLDGEGSMTGVDRLKAPHTRKTPDNRVRKYRELSPNEDGSYTVPAKYGALKLVSLGEIIDDPAYHTERYIFPIGYNITRPFLSTIDEEENVTYECRVVRGDGGPSFEVKASNTGKVYTGKSSSGAWLPIVHSAHTLRNRPINSSICGPDLFGFTCPEIAKWIQELPNVEGCRRYKPQTFVLKK